MPRDRAAAGRHARRKGSSNERDVAKKLRDWWGHGEWARTPASGGWATPQHREAFRTCGDVITSATDFNFCVELKKQEGWVMDHLLHNPGNQLLKWWSQAEGETPRGMVTLLMAARNHVPPVVIFSTYHMKKVFPEADGPLSFLPQFLYCNAGTPVSNLTVMALADFMSLSPDLFGRKMPNVEKADSAEVPEVQSDPAALPVR